MLPMLDRHPFFLLSLSCRKTTEAPSCQHSWAKQETGLKLGHQILWTLDEWQSGEGLRWVHQAP